MIITKVTQCKYAGVIIPDHNCDLVSKENEKILHQSKHVDKKVF